MHRLTGSYSSEIGPFVSQVMASIVSEVNGVSGPNNVDKDKSIMFITYRSPLPIHPRVYELSLGTCPSGDLRIAPSCVKEHDARDTNRMYKDTMCEDAMEFGDSHVRVPTQQELKNAKRVAANNSGDMNKVSRNDEREYERRKCIAYHISFESIVQVSLKRHPRRTTALDQVYII